MLKNNKKQKILLLSIATVLILGVGTVLAYIHTSTPSVENTFKPAQVSCEVEENISSGYVKTDVAIKNTSNTKAFIRAEVVVTWKKITADDNGDKVVETYGGAPVEVTDYIVRYNGDKGTLENSGWLEGADGFYYWKDAVPVDDPDTAVNEGITGILIKSIALAEGATPPEGYYLSVEIVASAIQAGGVSSSAETGGVGKAPAEIAWSNDKVTVTVDGDKLSIINK